ncbi:MAG TPA: NAD(P)/FAD-dependent oxidoreductase [Burkholderiales bacterium]|nr:NAD(P)/FAD-dependent oxidoreductase [Burkholderiales bacterium]
MDKVECVVVGAGVVGLAVARALALAGREVVILEAEHAIGTHASSRNSEVIHAGIYYPKGSLKARACVEGRSRLYAYCERHGVPYRRCGKLIVAADPAQVPELLGIRTKAHENGVADVAEIPAAEAMRLEPALRCVAALHSPSTGIIDSHALMLAYLGDAEAAGAMLALKSAVKRAVASGSGFEIHTEETAIRTQLLVNSAGFRAPSLARLIEGMPAESIPPEYYAKGNYYALAGRPPFTRLVYPVPEPGGLGVHVTLDLAGQARFGPDVEWLERFDPRTDYAVDPRRSDRFYAAIRRYWPALPEGALAPGYSGMRPKISGPKQPAADFLIQGPAEHGVPGLVNLFGIESPGLTASLALADDVAALLQT